MRSLLLAAVLSLTLGSAARAQDLKGLLDKGQVVLVETDDDGRFRQATAIIAIEQPVEVVWQIARDLDKFKEFMPKVVRSDMKVVSATRRDLELEIEIPGVNSTYAFRYDLDEANRTMKGKWLSGDLKDSTCQWKLVPYAGGTLLHYTVATRNFSGIAQSLEDDQQTITVGVNVGAALATTRAVKARAEALGKGVKSAAK